MITNEYFMTIYIFVLKGDLNGEIVVVRFFFCRVYLNRLREEMQIVVMRFPSAN